MSPRSRVTTSLVVAASVAACASSFLMITSCNDPAANATVVDVTVTFDEALAPQQLRVTITGDGEAFDPFVVPDAPRALDGAGETIEVILPDDVAGTTLRIDVEGLGASDDDVVGTGSADVEPAQGARTAVAIALAAPGEDAVCGDGAITAPEECDDEDTDDGDGCSSSCSVEPGFSCSGAPSVCVAGCGDGAVDGASGEACDDGDVDDGDGCSSSCSVEPGFVCDDAEPSVCIDGCGDGSVDDATSEECDDGNANAGDGCNTTCAVEPGFACDDAEPSVCEQTCDNGAVDAGEQCDDGNQVAGDGCSSSCAIEPGFACEVANTACTTICGDALVRGDEECDDDDTDDGDGCNALCAREPGFLCSGEPSVCLPTCVIGGVAVAEGTRDPVDACRACQPAVDESQFTPLPEGALCNDASFCNGVETCQSNVCTSPGDPCSATQPFCSEAADLCACTPASCDDGSFCDGDEVCQSDGTCTDGVLPSCGGLTDVCSDVAGACVECEDDGDCQAPNPSCFGAGASTARCTECPGCPCRSGEHDGGAGACVPAGQCSPGFARGFLDADLDSVGAGAQLADCDAVPFGAGLSTLSTDCDDGDAGAFRLLSLFPDNDGDGFTGAAANECVGAVIPASRSETASPPPFSSFQAAASVELTGAGVVDWFNDTGLINPLGGTTISDRIGNATDFTDPLSVTDFDLRVPANVAIRGVVVHVLRRLNDSDAGTAIDRTVSLVGGGAASANRASPVGWTGSFLDVAYGAPDDTWGLALTPALVNAAAFGVLLEVGATAGSNDAEAEIAHVWIEVYTDGTRADCNDNAGAGASVWTLRASHADVDVDRFTIGSESDRCVGVALPAGVTQRASASVDCFDTNASAFPGQTTFFSSSRGDGSFDYNCDSAQTKQTNTQDTACSCDIATGNCTATTDTVTPSESCGTLTSDDLCQDDGQCIIDPIGNPAVGCNLIQSTTPVRCR